jgi:peroxiredoxin
MKIATGRSRHTRHLDERLLGVTLPNPPLDCASGPVNRAQLAANSLVLFLHGHETSVQAGNADTSQCRSYREASLQFAALNVKIAAVCSLHPERTRAFARREGLPFPLISDPDLRLAWMLGLPRTALAEGRCRRRLTLIADRARIEHVLYPVRTPRREADQAMRWLLERQKARGDRGQGRAPCSRTPPSG